MFSSTVMPRFYETDAFGHVNNTVVAGFTHEYWKVAVIADPEVVAGYHFGAEAMLGEGGAHYRSAEDYAAACLAAALLALPRLF